MNLSCNVRGEGANSRLKLLSKSCKVRRRGQLEASVYIYFFTYIWKKKQSVFTMCACGRGGGILGHQFCVYFYLLLEGIKEPRSPSLRECHPHPRHERRMKDDPSNVIPRRQVYCCHGAYTLAVENDLIWGKVVSCS